MKIIFDNDATVTNYEKFIEKVVVPYFRKKYKLEIINATVLEIEDKYCLIDKFTNEEIKEIMDSFWISFRFVKYTLFSPFRLGAAKTLRYFLRKHYQVEIHTSRAKTYDNSIVGKLARMFTIGQYWLQGVFLRPSKFKFYLNDEEKLEGVFNANPTVVFDDKPWLIDRYIEQGLYVLCVDGVHNQLLQETSHMKRINSLKKSDVCIKLKELLGDILINACDKGAKSNHLYRKLYSLQRPVLQIFKPIILNRQNIIRTNRGIIYVSNHRSTLDPIVITAVLRESIHWVALKRFFEAKDSIFNNSKNPLLCKFTAYIFTKLGFFPIERKKDNPKSNNIQSIREILSFLKIGHKVGIFPEGTTVRPEGQLLGEFDYSFLTFASETRSFVQPVTILWIVENNKKRAIINFGKAFAVSNKDKEEIKQKYYSTLKDMLTENIVEAKARGAKILY